MKGRKYLGEAICLLVNKGEDETAAVLYQVAEQNGISYNSAIRAIQTAIADAWAHSDIETLKGLCPVRIDIDTGLPAPTEFMRYYAERIRKTM